VANPSVSGSEPFVRYTSGASWTRDPQPTEPPLGYSVDALEPVGEAQEVAASLSAIEKATSASAPAAVALGEVAPAGVVPAQPSSPSPSQAAAHERLAEVLPKIITRRGLR
jgi:hypothetical protein